MLRLVRYFTLTIVMFCASEFSQAQTQHFVYLQTENKQPFNITLNSVIYNSSASGYLIIPKLTDNTYNITIGFPKGEFPKQSLSFVVAGKDAGYLLKNFGASGWGLFDLQSMKVTMATPGANQSQAKIADNSDNFSKTLSEVVDTDLSSISKAQQTRSTPVAVKSNRQIKLLSNKVDASGRQMIYVASENNNSDTISVFIPSASTSKSDENIPDNSKTETKPLVSAGETKTPVINNELEGNNASGNSSVKMVNSDCKDIANEKDFLRLRKLMAAKSNEDGMVQVANKEFKKRCYSTDNLKSLSMLFFTDKGRYSFFDAAYPHVYDSDNFASLKQLLSDNYYILRFEAMIHK